MQKNEPYLPVVPMGIGGVSTASLANLDFEALF